MRWRTLRWLNTLHSYLNTFVNDEGSSSGTRYSPEAIARVQELERRLGEYAGAQERTERELQAVTRQKCDIVSQLTAMTLMYPCN